MLAASSRTIPQYTATMPTRGAVCQECGYSLFELAEHRCPECGRHFDPTDANTYDSSLAARTARRRRQLVGRIAASPWLIVPLTWASLPVFLLGSLAAAAGLPLIIFHLYRRRWKSAAALTLGSPLFAFALWGVIDYGRGVGALRS